MYKVKSWCLLLLSWLLMSGCAIHAPMSEMLIGTLPGVIVGLLAERENSSFFNLTFGNTGGPLIYVGIIIGGTVGVISGSKAVYWHERVDRYGDKGWNR